LLYDYAKLLGGNGASLRLAGLSCASEDALPRRNGNPDCRDYDVQHEIRRVTRGRAQRFIMHRSLRFRIEIFDVRDVSRSRACRMECYIQKREIYNEEFLFKYLTL